MQLRLFRVELAEQIPDRHVFGHFQFVPLQPARKVRITREASAPFAPLAYTFLQTEE